MLDMNMGTGSLTLAESCKSDLPLSLADKLRRMVVMAEQGRDADVFAAMEYLQREREWPEWLKAVCYQIDAPKDRPTNLETT